MIRQALCVSFKKEIFEANHDFTQHVFKIALIRKGQTGSYGKQTRNYSELGSDEVPNAGGYTTGGLVLAGLKGPEELDDAGVLTWTETPQWKKSTISADGALIYNATQDGRAVGVLSFGTPREVVNGTFKILLKPSMIRYK